MALNNYQLLKGKPSALALDDDASPHIEIRIEAAGTSHRIAVNARSSVPPHDLLYCRRDPLMLPILSTLKALPEGITDLVNDRPDLALDYVQGGFIERSDMHIAPFSRSGPKNDLRDYIEPTVRAAIHDPGITFYAFGETWGPEPKMKDKYFGFLPGNGIHDIHMNQGSSGSFAATNGPDQDGALLIHFSSGDKWVGLFFAFQTQSWDTAPATGGGGELPLPDVTIDPLAPGIAIVAALINAAGREQGGEAVTIINRTDADMSLNNWFIEDHEHRRMPLSGALHAGETRRFTLQDQPDFPRLANKGGTITLIAADGTIADRITYTKDHAAREGWTTLLR